MESHSKKPKQVPLRDFHRRAEEYSHRKLVEHIEGVCQGCWMCEIENNSQMMAKE